MPPFERSVFLNCPFDDDYAPILQAIAFCIYDLGFYPRLAPENADNAIPRLDRIAALIKGSRYGIHDLSRCRSSRSREFARMNMPFELGIDHGCARFGSKQLRTKSILVLEVNRYDYQKALSDISGWDIQTHGSNHIKAVQIVTDWLHRHAGAERRGAAGIQVRYAAFQEWYWERELKSGASEEDIKAYPTVRVLAAMDEWSNLPG